jgi:hypothetical protein
MHSLKYSVAKFIALAALSIVSVSLQAQHTLILKTGEKMQGTVQSLSNGSISFLFKGNTMTFKVDEVSTIQFSATTAASSSAAPADGGSKGVEFVMAGRKLVTQPKYENLTMKKGVVVVEITIDKDGRVMKASPGAEGTTTTDQYLLTKAQQAAQSAAFDKCPKCPLEMKGTISITF